MDARGLAIRPHLSCIQLYIRVHSMTARPCFGLRRRRLADAGAAPGWRARRRGGRGGLDGAFLARADCSLVGCGARAASGADQWIVAEREEEHEQRMFDALTTSREKLPRANVGRRARAGFQTGELQEPAAGRTLACSAAWPWRRCPWRVIQRGLPERRAR